MRLVKEQYEPYAKYSGLIFDEAYKILNEDDIQIGYTLLSYLDDGKIYIEWIEISTVFQGNHYLRKVMNELKKIKSKSKTIQLQSSDENLEKYMSIGCVYIGKDLCTGLSTLEY